MFAPRTHLSKDEINKKIQTIIHPFIRQRITDTMAKQISAKLNMDDILDYEQLTFTVYSNLNDPTTLDIVIYQKCVLCHMHKVQWVGAQYSEKSTFFNYFNIVICSNCWGGMDAAPIWDYKHPIYSWFTIDHLRAGLFFNDLLSDDNSYIQNACKEQLKLRGEI